MKTTFRQFGRLYCGYKWHKLIQYTYIDHTDLLKHFSRRSGTGFSLKLSQITSSLIIWDHAQLSMERGYCITHRTTLALQIWMWISMYIPNHKLFTVNDPFIGTSRLTYSSCLCKSQYITRGETVLICTGNIAKISTFKPTSYPHTAWASYQIRKIAGCACAGNAGKVFPRRRFHRNR